MSTDNSIESFHWCDASVDGIRMEIWGVSSPASVALVRRVSSVARLSCSPQQYVAHEIHAKHTAVDMRVIITKNLLFRRFRLIREDTHLPTAEEIGCKAISSGMAGPRPGLSGKNSRA